MSPNESDKFDENDYDKEKCHYYSVREHKAFFIILIVLAFIVCAFVFPWLLGVIVHSLVGWNKTGNADVIWFFSVNDNNLLPDFMGGMVGLFTGFIVEWWLIGKLQHISKYSSIVDPLFKQLSKIKQDALKFIGYLEVKEKENPNIEICRDMFDYWRVEDLVKNLDNYSLLYNLPRYSPRKKTFEDSKLADQIDALYIKIIEYKSMHKPCESKCTGKDGELDHSKLQEVLLEDVVTDVSRKNLMIKYCQDIIRCANNIAYILKPKDIAKTLGE